MKYVIVQIYRFEVEFNLLKTMELEFQKQGYVMLLWTNVNINAANFNFIPLEFSKKTENFFTNGDKDNLEQFDIVFWKNHISKLEILYSTNFDIYDCEYISNYSSSIFKLFNPALFICWSGFEPCYAISREIAISKKIPTLIWEAGILPSTLVLESKGLMSHSQLSYKSIDELSNDFSNAELYLLNQKKQIFPTDFEKSKNKCLNLLILGSMDIANGCYYPKSEYKHDLGEFTDSIDIAIKLAELNISCNITYRPHPREPKGQQHILCENNISIDTNSSLEKSILESDIVIGYGSKSDFTALILGVPFIFIGKGILSGKSCCYEVMTVSDLKEAIYRASLKMDFDLHKGNFKKLVGFLLNQYLYNRIQNADCKKSIIDLVGDAIGYANQNESKNIYKNELSSYGKILKNCHEQEYIFNNKYLVGKSTAIDKIKREISQPEIKNVIIDFDHTLWLGNTTEQFINIATPKLPCEILDKVVSKFWDKNLGSLKQKIARDHLRVLVLVILTPWNLYRWKLFCRKNINKYWNKDLYDTIDESGKNKLVISLGFNILIKKILNIKLGSKFQMPLYASKLFDFSTNIRKKGKVECIKDKVDLSQSYTITDSIEDKNLLINSHSGILHRWAEPIFEKQLGYYPFRYLIKGKYLNKGYLKNYIISQELVIWLFLFAYNLNFIVPAFCLFFSFQLIYEIGYYENDFMGAKNESNPRLINNHINFYKYNIKFNAWFFSLFFMVVGLYILNVSEFIKNTVIWLAILVLLRIIFHLYNKSIPSKRKELYFFLQFFKNFSGIAILIPNIVGVVLAISNMLQHYIRYVIYRTHGNYDEFDNFLARIVFFICLMVIVATLKIELNPFIITIALIWLVYRWNIQSRLINKVCSRVFRFVK